MDNNEYTIYCAKCGAEMSSNSRYCMKCGTLNYEHEANKNMKGFMPKDMKTSYKVGSGKFLLRNNQSNQMRTSLAAHTGNKKTCFLINILLFLIFIIVSFLITVEGNYTIEGILKSSFPMISIVISVIFFYLYAMQLVFMKCNMKWWVSLIPIYNLMELAGVLFQKKWIGLISCIPGIGIIGFLVMFYQLGVKFQYNGIFTALLPIISIPMIGYGNHLYDGCMFVEGDVNLALEKDYKRKKYFMFIIGIFFLFGVGVTAYNKFTSTGAESFSLDNIYYVFAAKQITKKVEENINSGIISCSNGEYINGQGVYYFYFGDLGDEVFLPFYITRDPITGYVKVDNTSGVSNYYVSLTDGKKGFSEILIKDVKASSVKSYSKLSDVNNYVVCSFGK